MFKLATSSGLNWVYYNHLLLWYTRYLLKYIIMETKK
nr:MAG TPA: hypothetical protein [Caudoviricetes sp.]